MASGRDETSSGSVLQLKLLESIELPSRCHQLIVGARFHAGSPLEHHDAVGMPDRRQPMGHNERRPPLDQPLY